MTSPRRAIGLCAVLLCLAPSRARAAASLTKVVGFVQVQLANTHRWDVVKGVPLELSEGDTVKTALKAEATVTFKDGSRVELAANSAFTLEEASETRSSL